MNVYQFVGREEAESRKISLPCDVSILEGETVESRLVAQEFAPGSDRGDRFATQAAFLRMSSIMSEDQATVSRETFPNQVTFQLLQRRSVIRKIRDSNIFCMLQ